jgi:hypothetical protein
MPYRCTTNHRCDENSHRICEGTVFDQNAFKHLKARGYFEISHFVYWTNSIN